MTMQHNSQFSVIQFRSTQFLISSRFRTPLNKLSMSEILQLVRKETQIYARANVDGIIAENMHDLPYIKQPVGPEIISSMTVACQKDMLLGVQILAAANKEALAVARCTGFDLIRAECFVFAHVADEGWMDGCAGDLVRYSRSINADSIAIITDVKKKHSSHAVTGDLTVGEEARAAELFLSDGIVVTGRCTACAPDLGDIEVRSTCSLPIFVGSGVNVSNADQFVGVDAFIVGSDFKKDGKWMNELDIERVRSFMNRVNSFK
ncbi:unnamed protein product [Angiostrongylus costaricensis]|uniref:BtpA family membrane complex biogenesis protein n=1 Tax=Angiostrongylus costaricensis TaxID=334426 RepID=A0A0R3PFR9_ANGCS|nr:unnamed protein product [Angiostrongylus costaricensis]